LDTYERSKLGDAVKEHNFKKGESIISEGQEGDTFFLIAEGTCMATKLLGGTEPTKVKDYERGNYFGERALLTNDLRAANIIVTSDECKVLAIDRLSFQRLLGNLDDLLKKNMDMYNKINQQ